MEHRRLMLVFAVALLLISSALVLMGTDPVAVFGGSVLVLFLANALLDKPKKHKDFTYSDQLKGMLQSYGGNPPPEIVDPEKLEGDEAARPRPGRRDRESSVTSGTFEAGSNREGT